MQQFFNPRDATVHCMPDCLPDGRASMQSSHLGTFSFVWQGRFIVTYMGIKTGHLGRCLQTARE